MTETSRGDVLDHVYEALSDSDPGRSKRIDWARRAGGEVR